ncbi:hypothetical protein D6829_00565 [Candidatus Pacearchaeota archaeon]|nr:MAG: hypothetical protein D6829_00565 [Candidatus Pacearchaeota archaeon]
MFESFFLKGKRGSFYFNVSWIFVFVVLLAILVLASPPVWQGSDVNYTAVEDTPYFHDLSKNISGFNNDVTFAINTIQTNITWTNSTGTYEVSESDIPWIKIIDSNTGNLSINATYDNQTGFFEIPIGAKNVSNNEEAITVFEFIVNATNDAPKFLNLESEYNLTEDAEFKRYVNGSDEEEHYPLWFNLTFINNCTHASWSGRNNGENCSVFNLTAVSNTAALMNWTPGRNDVGEYWAYLSVSDDGENYSCPHSFCDNSTYKTNKTSPVFVVKFNVFSTLGINVSDCDGKNLTEGVYFSCVVNITTKGKTDTVNVSTYANWNNGYTGPISNHSWFYPNDSFVADNFTIKVNISFIPTKKNVGNWSINFTALDEVNGLSSSDLIRIFVNWTESPVVLDDIQNYTIYENKTFYLNAYDNDLLIEDKQTKNENLTFVSNTSWVKIENTQTTFGNNYTTATVKINYDAVKDLGDANYSVKINVTDEVGNFDEKVFIVEIVNDSRAVWNESKSNVSVSNEGDNIFMNLSEYVSDPDGDALTFSYSSDTSFPNFNLTSDGIINFTSTDEDVGQHIVTINASDGKLDSFRSFNFTIYNVVDSPVIEALPPTITAAEGSPKEITLNVYDNDFLVPQKNFYDENLTINLTIENLTYVSEKISFTFNFSVLSNNLSTYLANFTPDGKHVGEYNVTINVTDKGGEYDTTSFILNITQVNDAPNISSFSNQTSIVGSDFYFDFNATDEEDSPTLPENGNITFSLRNLSVGGDFLKINSTTGVVNLSLNSSHVGYWEYNLSVNDTDGAVSWTIFTLTVFGAPNITGPSSDYVFNWTEGKPTGKLNFSIDYGVNNTNLTYVFYLDKIVYNSSTSYYYTNISNGLRDQGNFTWQNAKNFSWNFTPNYTDETYGMLKNLTLVVYNPKYPNLNDSFTWKVNVSHRNQNLTFKSGSHIPDVGPISTSSSKTINLSKYFEDVDYFDKKISQTVNFTLVTVSGSGYVKAASSFSGWNLTLSSPVNTTEVVKVVGYEYNSSGQRIGNATSNEFQVEFIESSSPTTTTSSGGGGGGSTTKFQFFSLRLIVPRDIVILDKDHIDIGFSVKNDGQVDLSGINLSSVVSFNNVFSNDISIGLEETYIPLLKAGEVKDFNMRITANTQRSGRYKATIFANVTSPKFSDFADFFIELQKTNESEISQILIFTEKLVAENPECIELTENLREAKELFKKGFFEESKKKAGEIIQACEDAISANEQIRYPVSFAKDSFYTISFVTLAIFFIGFIFYVYKRVRFNKYKVDEVYVR